MNSWQVGPNNIFLITIIFIYQYYTIVFLIKYTSSPNIKCIENGLIKIGLNKVVLKFKKIYSNQNFGIMANYFGYFSYKDDNMGSTETLSMSLLIHMNIRRLLCKNRLPINKRKSIKILTQLGSSTHWIVDISWQTLLYNQNLNHFLNKPHELGHDDYKPPPCRLMESLLKQSRTTKQTNRDEVKC